ncbi:MAG: type II secretion system F family protein [Armatimonadetes bacterium]|nr:type II secretion system F family protein [Armatimonadota bacterium]
MTRQAMHLFFLQMSVMVQSGVPIRRALEVAGTSQDSRNGLARAAVARLEQGASLSASLKDWLDPVTCQVVRQGERTGALVHTLAGLAEESRAAHLVVLRLQQALLYPLAVCGSSLAIALFMLHSMIPRLLEAVAVWGPEQPWPTRLMLWIVRHGLIWKIAGSMGLVLGSLYLHLRRYPERFRALQRSWLEALPLLGRALRGAELARLCRRLSLLLETGIPLDRALEWLAAPESRHQEALTRITARLRLGQTLSAALRREEQLPGLLVSMVSVGEESGKIPALLKKAASLMEAESESLADDFLAWLEPLTLMFLGLGVGFLLLVCLLPVYNLSTLPG